MDYAELCIQSFYSLGNSTVSIPHLVERAHRLGYGAIALTDYNQAYGVVDFVDLCRQYHIKPIVGCTLLVREDKNNLSQPVTIWVMDDAGWSNYVELISEGNRTSDTVPYVPFSLLASKTKGLIAAVSGVVGTIPRAILQGRVDTAREQAFLFRDAFGEDHFYLGLQDHGAEDEGRVNKGILDISKATGMPLLAMNDVRFIHAKDFAFSRSMMSDARQGDWNDVCTPEHYLKSPSQMKAIFRNSPEALRNSVTVASMCNFGFSEKFLKPLVYPTPTASSGEDYLRLKSFEGARSRYGDTLPDFVRQRLASELETIMEAGYTDYFLVIFDFVEWAKKQGIPVGPGRGSVVGSLVAYCLGITDVDPLERGLLFERFLNSQRATPPDIDVDFCHERRHEVVEYIRRRYGEERVGGIASFGAFGSQKTLATLAECFSIKPSTLKELMKRASDPRSSSPPRLGNGTPATHHEAFSSKESELLSAAERFRAIPKYRSVHPSGVVVSREPLGNKVPLYFSKEGRVISSFGMEQLQSLGLVKFDILGIRMLTVVHRAIRSILGDQQSRMELMSLCNIRESDLPADRNLQAQYIIQSIPMDDRKTFELISEGVLEGVFHLDGSRGLKKLVRTVKPSNWNEVADVMALYRPGPLRSGATKEYVERRQGRKPVNFLNDDTKAVLEDTYGVFVYQEQVMQIAMRLAGYTLSESDSLRLAIAKKDVSLMLQHEKMFLQGAEKMGKISRRHASLLFEQIKHFGAYSFNKSHAQAYAKLSVQTAFLKAHFPQYFIVEAMNIYEDQMEKLRSFAIELATHFPETPLLPVDVNRSNVSHRVEGQGIRLGLLAVRGIGVHEAGILVRARGERAFASFRDFCERVWAQGRDLGTPMHDTAWINALIHAGGLTDLGNVATLEASLKTFWEHARKSYHLCGDHQLALFDLGVSAPQEAERPEYPESVLAELELASTGLHVRNSPLHGFLWMKERLPSASDVDRIHDLLRTNKPVFLGGYIKHIRVRDDRKENRMAFVELEDFGGPFKVVCFSNTYNRYFPILKKGSVIIVKVVPAKTPGGDFIVKEVYDAREIADRYNFSN